MSKGLGKYLSRQELSRPLSGPGVNRGGYQAAVVVPALAESEDLPATLASLAASEGEIARRTLVLVVVNNPAPSIATGGEDESARRRRRDNQATLGWLHGHASSFPFGLAWIDAASPEREFPGRAGVGAARKAGCDSVLRQIADRPGFSDLPPERFTLFHLDGDTLVHPGYLEAGAGAIQADNECASGVIAFRHRMGRQPAITAAINAYELYLHYYVLGLRFAGSPYAFHTVGSTMVSSAEAYLKVAGIPAGRQAGEDFYFLQKLAKTSGVKPIATTAVYPSPRPSRRVPFGTGPRIYRALNEDTQFETYDPEVFRVLSRIHSTMRDHADSSAGYLLAAFPESARDFMEKRQFNRVWALFRRQYQDTRSRRQAFHQWFDGFATLKLIHQLTRTRRSQRPLFDCWDELVREYGLPELAGGAVERRLHGFRCYWWGNRCPASR